MAAHTLETLVRNPKNIIEIFQEAVQDPHDFFSNLDCDAEYMDSAMAIAAGSGTSLFINAILTLTPSLVMMLPFTIFMGLIFSAIAAGVLHALSGITGADGSFKQYFAAMGWLVLLSLPLCVVSALGFTTLSSIAMIALGSYAFVVRFSANRKLAMIGAGALIAFLALAAMIAPKPKSAAELAQMNAMIQQQAEYSSESSARRPQQAKAVGGQMPKPANEAAARQWECDNRIKELRGVAQISGKRSDMIRTMAQYEAGLTEWVKRSGGEEAVRQYAQRNPAKARDYIKILNDRECTRKILAAIGG